MRVDEFGTYRSQDVYDLTIQILDIYKACSPNARKFKTRREIIHALVLNAILDRDNELYPKGLPENVWTLISDLVDQHQ